MILKPKKVVRIAYSYARSKFRPTPVFLRIIPTDRCNLKCKYCFQYDNSSHMMSKEEFDIYLEKAVELGTGVISFLGGEPMIWPHLYYAIERCSNKGIITEMHTNATLLSDKNLERLGKAGLDMLNLSVDSLAKTSQSDKNLLTKNDLAVRVDSFRKRFGAYVGLNAVITKSNIDDIENLINFAHDECYPLSMGFVVPPFSKKNGFDGKRFLFTKDDFPKLRKMVDMIHDKKRNGYHIIDADSYYEGIFDFLDRKNDWDCKVARKTVSGITVAPDGRLRSCSKLMDYMDYRFADMTPKKIQEVRDHCIGIIEKCNPNCYSNCAYSAYYYTRHKFEFLVKRLFPALKRIIRR